MDTLKQSIILFDLDGTLTDSEEGIIRSTQYMQEKMAAGNAMANMQVICEKYAPSVKAYLLIPLVGSLFADFLNSLVITVFINFI